MIYLGSDHRGFKLKGHLIKWLEKQHIPYKDYGNTEYDADDDYVDFAEKVGKTVASEKDAKGIIICGTGIGVCIAANKINGIRAGLVQTKDMAKSARNDDDVNVLALSGDLLAEDEAILIVKTFLETPFDPQVRFLRRIDKIKKIETQ